MTAIYKRELKSYLTSMIGYVFIFFILLLEGIYFTAYNMQGAYPVFGSTLSAIAFIFLILVPILTMKSIAEERKQKTDQLLLTAPVSVGEVVAGKYLALITVYMIPMAIISLYPLIMMKYGTVSVPMTYTAILGFFLLGFTQIAMGVFFSSITESSVIAAVMTFIVLFLCYMMEGIETLIPVTAMTSFVIYIILVMGLAVIFYHMVKNIWIAGIAGILGEAGLIVTYIVKSSVFEGSVQRILEIFNIVSRFDNFTGGILDIQSIVYFLSVIIIFLFLSVQTITKRRWN
ncbi:MAG: ABC transporter permease [Oliverpabstia sp.]